jgi:hypothetical protein
MHDPSEDPTAARHDEARRFARYLVRAEPGAAELERYARACDRLFPPPQSPADEALVAFARRHPRALPWLDAACALRRPEALLRRRLLLLAAILETTPRFAPRFLPRHASAAGLLQRLAGHGVRAAAAAALGLLLLPLVDGARR